ncbi:long-chain fatty acid--CoA ligase [Rhodospirillales bacterium TMPK1]|uniref:Long-chain fatty acid--CoA ligase n=2 Tax=Roseiterribacter gracilis TaxID=2812848 RepID=A0A8S8X8V0_9PROT|nr:long-chain fatty acid--CoA ligase [Rhodospirillales bacterium TMPK1]
MQHALGFLERAVSTAGDRAALLQDGLALRYDAFAAAAAALGRQLRALGAAGEGVAVLLPNSAELNVAVHAVWYASAKAVLFNPAYPVHELVPLLGDAAPRIVICSADAAAPLREAATSLGVAYLLTLGMHGEVTLDELSARPHLAPPPAPHPSDVAVLLYTGGTTGIAKGVEHSHASVVAMVEAMQLAWPTRYATETWLNVAPSFHVYGFLMGLMNPVAAAATLIPVARFKPDLVVDALASHRVTVFAGGPASLYGALLAAETFPSADLSSLRVCAAGGAPFPVELLARWQRAVGCAIREAYGMTEMAPITGNQHATLKSGSVGPALPGVELSIVDTELGTHVLGAGAAGEVRVRGAHLFRGYRGRADETAAALRDGWLHTGDIGYLDDDGYLFLVDRKKDLILVGGFNVYPREVEEVLIAHDAVREVAVLGAPDARKGEAVVAFVVLAKDATATVDDLHRHCAERLVTYKVPSRIELLDAVPRTAANKTDRRALRAILGALGALHDKETT